MVEIDCRFFRDAGGNLKRPQKNAVPRGPSRTGLSPRLGMTDFGSTIPKELALSKGRVVIFTGAHYSSRPVRIEPTICTPDRYCDHIGARGRADHII
jgi:hypothetical protein